MDVLRQLKGEPVGALPLVFANAKAERKICDEHSLPVFGIGAPAPVTCIYSRCVWDLGFRVSGSGRR
jgi:hypothetical protein